MYIDYARYAQLGGSVSEADFPRMERRAERLLDDWTMGRIRRMQQPLPPYVAEAMTEIVDALPGMEGERVTSFSNGVTSFAFDVSKSEESSLYDEVARIVPPQIMSRSVHAS